MKVAAMEIAANAAWQSLPSASSASEMALASPILNKFVITFSASSIVDNILDVLTPRTGEGDKDHH